ncbi:type II secretion system F family protein [Candidatus Gracilibacteria bacterium]|nr:type II secretion system F family protein [Candidatus Gracilibacteria bacterium]
MSILFGIVVSSIVSLLISGIRRVRTPGYELQIAQFGTGQANAERRTFYQRTLRPLALALADNITVLRPFVTFATVAKRLDYAGNPGGIGAHELHGLQILGMLTGLAIGLLLTVLGIPFGQFALILLPLGGFVYPLLWLRGKANKRQRTISVTLPDLLDMLAVCISAGMGFEIALSLLSERNQGPLYEEVARLLRELHVGESRQQAFRHLGERNSSPELRVFIDGILQAEELGTPIAETLERQAEDIRIRRRHRARAEGAKVATKISLVIVMLSMPSIMCLILGALALTIARGTGLIPE